MFTGSSVTNELSQVEHLPRNWQAKFTVDITLNILQIVSSITSATASSFKDLINFCMTSNIGNVIYMGFSLVFEDKSIYTIFFKIEV